MLAVLASCEDLERISEERLRSARAGELSVLLCRAPQLENCTAVDGISVAPGVAKLDEHELAAHIPDNQLRSFQVGCGRPTSVILYENCNFTGQVAAYQCIPDAQNPIHTIEEPHLGPLAGRVSAIAFSERGRADGVARLEHAEVPFWPVGTSPDPAMTFGTAINATLTGGGAPATGPLNATALDLIPQCGGLGGGGAGATGVLSARTIATRIFWTDDLNVPIEIPPRREGDERLFRAACLVPDDANFARGNLLAIHHAARIRVSVLGIGAPEYAVGMYWYFRPEIRQLPSGPRVFLTPVRSSWSVGGQSGWDILDGLIPNIGFEPGPADAIDDALSSTVPGAAGGIACAVLNSVRTAGNAVVSGAGDAILTNRDRVSFVYDAPPSSPPGGVPCNALSGHPCGDYRSALPTLVLHDD
jgi:hypothetical protein